MIDGGVVLKTTNSETFMKEVEKLVKIYKMDYMDAVVYFCEKNNMEIEAAASFIKNNVNLKSKITVEAENLNYLPKRARLPI